jgi:hypothetical protein
MSIQTGTLVIVKNPVPNGNPTAYLSHYVSNVLDVRKGQVRVSRPMDILSNARESVWVPLSACTEV